MLCDGLSCCLGKFRGAIRALLAVDDFIDSLWRFVVDFEAVVIILDDEISVVLVDPYAFLGLKCFKLMERTVRLMQELQCIKLRPPIIRRSLQIQLHLLVRCMMVYHRLHLLPLVIKCAIAGHRARFLVRRGRRTPRQTSASIRAANVLEQSVIGFHFPTGLSTSLKICGFDCVDPHVELVVRAESLESRVAFELVKQVVFKFVFRRLETGRGHVELCLLEVVLAELLGDAVNGRVA